MFKGEEMKRMEEKKKSKNNKHMIEMEAREGERQGGRGRRQIATTL